MRNPGWLAEELEEISLKRILGILKSNNGQGTRESIHDDASKKAEE
jgi:hypothetical protein